MICASLVAPLILTIIHHMQHVIASSVVHCTSDKQEVRTRARCSRQFPYVCSISNTAIAFMPCFDEAAVPTHWSTDEQQVTVYHACTWQDVSQSNTYFMSAPASGTLPSGVSSACLPLLPAPVSCHLRMKPHAHRTMSACAWLGLLALSACRLLAMTVSRCTRAMHHAPCTTHRVDAPCIPDIVRYSCDCLGVDECFVHWCDVTHGCACPHACALVHAGCRSDSWPSACSKWAKPPLLLVLLHQGMNMFKSQTGRHVSWHVPVRTRS
jgi:hypothetical protein